MCHQRQGEIYFRMLQTGLGTMLLGPKMTEKKAQRDKGTWAQSGNRLVNLMPRCLGACSITNSYAEAEREVCIMARFPRTQPEIQALAQNMVTGLTANVADFPAPPVAPLDLQALLDSFITLSDAQVAAQAAAEQATATKAAGFEELVTAMKADLRYAEDAVNYDDAKLTAIGWGGRADGVALQPPGQARTLGAPRQGEGWIFLDWKQPSDGGSVAAYKIERRERPTGDWILVSMAIESEATLNNQDRGKDWEYRVIATNKAGEGVPSNTVAAVL